MNFSSIKFLKAVTGLALASLLGACGGGGGSSGDSIFDNGNTGTGGTTPTAADLVVVLDKPSISNSTTDTVNLTVTAVNSSNAVVGNVPVSFGVDNGGVITPGGTKTDATTGKVTAAVQIGSDRTNRTLTVTIASGSLSKKVSFNVVDSLTGGSVAGISMKLDKSSIPKDGSQTITLTATTIDAGNSAVGGAPLTFTVTDVAGSAGAVVNTGGRTTSDATTGILMATISLGSNQTTRTIAVTASSGTVSRTVTFDVVEPLVVAPTANSLSMLLDKSSVGNSGSEVVNVTVTAVGASGNVVAGIPVAFSVTNNATIAVGSTSTDAQGVVTAQVKIGDDRSNRRITVTATSGTLTRSASFMVTGAKLQATALPASPDPSTSGNKVEFRLTDPNLNAMVDMPYTVTAPGLPTQTGVTNANGSFDYVYTAPATPGTIDITATAGGVSLTQTVTVRSPSTTPPSPTVAVVSQSLSASPNVVSVNTSETSNRSEIRALFLGANNVPVKNVRVLFDLNGDTNSVGGTLSSGTGLIYSDANGAATTSYSPANRSSPVNGVTIRACYGDTDAIARSCVNTILTTLTVVSEPLSISIGTDNTLADGASGLTYVKSYVLLVVDAAGNPKADVQITPSLDLTHYYKGFYVWNSVAAAWIQHYYADAVDTVGVAPSCLAEDLNKNGSIDAGDDKNGNAQLDPRKSDASIYMSGSTKTDSSGTAVLKIEYPKSVAGWAGFRITASASGVLSPPAYYTGILPVSATAIKTETPPPSFVTSPYGTRRKSSDGGAGSYCTNSD